MNIENTPMTPEHLARRIGNVKTDLRSFSSTMLLFSLTPSELVAAIGFRPVIAEELADEAKESEAIAIVWEKAQAGLAAQAAEKAVDDLLNQCRISIAPG